MKRFLTYLIFIINLLFSVHGTDAYAGITERTILNELDLSELNQTQRTMFKKELAAYTTSLDALAQSDTAQWKKKAKELLCHIRDGFRIYKLSRDSEVEKKISELDSKAHARVYVLTWVEDAILNNIFLRLAQAYYETTRPDRYVILKYKYVKAPSYTLDNPVLKPDKPEIELSKKLEDTLDNKISELNAVCFNPLKNSSGCTMDDRQCGLNFNTSITNTIDWLNANIGMVSNVHNIQFLDPAGNSFTASLLGKFQIITAVKYGPLISFHNNEQIYDAKYNDAGGFIGYYDEKGKQFEQSNYDLTKTHFIAGYEERNTTAMKASFKTLVNSTNPFKTDKFASKENPKQVNILESLYSEIEKGKVETEIIVDFHKDAVREEEGSIGKFSVTLITCSDKKSQPLASTPEELKKKYKDIKPIEGTSVSFLENGYLIKKNGKEIEVNKITEDEITVLKKKIEDGDIAEQSEILFKTVDGKTQIDALGYRNKNFGPSGAALARGFTWNSSVRTEIQTRQKEIFNSYLSKLDNKSLLDIDPAKSSSGKFYDNKGLEVKEEKIYTKLLKMTKLTGELLKEIKIPESVWNYDKRTDYDASLVNISPYFSGVGDAIIDDAKSIPQLVIMTTELVLDDEKLQSLFDKFSNLTWSKVGKGIVNGSVGLATSIYNDLKGDKASNWHSKGTMTYNAMTIFLPGKVLGKADDAIKKGTDDALENVGKVTEKIDELSGPFGDGFRAVRKKLDELTEKQRLDFRDDLERSADLANTLSKAPDPDALVDSWKLLQEAGRDNLRKEVSTLESLTNLLTNPKLKSIFDDDFLKDVAKAQKNAGTAKVPAMKEIFDNLNAAFKDLDLNKIQGIDLLKGELKRTDFGKMIGSNWVLEYMGKNQSLFKGFDNIIFESVEKIDDVTGSLIRKIDVKSFGGGKFTFFEFKSVGKVPPMGFAEQFIKDLRLTEVTNLNQLKWIFDGKKVTSLTKADFVNTLKNVKELNNQKVIDLFESYRQTIRYSSSIEDVDDIIEFMTKENSWFNTIFQIR